MYCVFILCVVVHFVVWFVGVCLVVFLLVIVVCARLFIFYVVLYFFVL